MEEDKRRVLTLIVKQLQQYDLNSIASVVASAAGVDPSYAPSNDLHDCLTRATADAHADFISDGAHVAENQPPIDPDIDGPFLSGLVAQEPESTRAPVPGYATLFVATHKNACRAAAFSRDGQYCATGSQDTTMKVMSVERTISREPGSDDKPIIRTLYDHTDEVNDIQFHPNGFVLASASSDRTIKLFDLQRVSNKKAFRTLSDSHPVLSIAFHPSGDYLVAGTTHSHVRVYDVRQLTCFTSHDALTGSLPVTAVDYAPNGSFYASASDAVRLYDGRSGDVVKTFKENAWKISISKSGQYLLTSGVDGVRIWDIGTGKSVVAMQGQHSCPAAVWSWSEDYVIGCEDKVIHVWCCRTGSQLERLTGHNAPIYTLAASPTDNCFLSGSDDFRARFWYADRSND